MPEIKLGTITDPKIVRMLAAGIDSDYCIAYDIANKNGKPVSITFLLDVDDPKEAQLLEAMRES